MWPYLGREAVLKLRRPPSPTHFGVRTSYVYVPFLSTWSREPRAHNMHAFTNNQAFAIHIRHHALTAAGLLALARVAR